MNPVIPTALLAEAADWAGLHRLERKQLGMALRRLGLTYSENRSVIAVPSSTLSNWCRDDPLRPTQVDAMKLRAGPHNCLGIP